MKFISFQRSFNPSINFFYKCTLSRELKGLFQYLATVCNFKRIKIIISLSVQCSVNFMYVGGGRGALFQSEKKESTSNAFKHTSLSLEIDSNWTARERREKKSALSTSPYIHKIDGNCMNFSIYLILSAPHFGSSPVVSQLPSKLLRLMHGLSTRVGLSTFRLSRINFRSSTFFSLSRFSVE